MNKQTPSQRTLKARGRVIKRLAATATALAIMSGALLSVAPANAAAQTCPSGYSCTWGDRYYLTSGLTSARFAFYQKHEDMGLGSPHYPGTSVLVDNTATSVYNNGNSEWVYYYRYANKGTLLLSMNIKTGYDQLNVQVPGANDRISSGYFASFN